MHKNTIKIRLMDVEDFKAVVRIDEQTVQAPRLEYFEQKFERLFKSGEYVPTSFVAQNERGAVVGFIMGELFIGEYGLSGEGASVDSVGVDADYQRQGIGNKLMGAFVEHLKQLGVEKVSTLVDKNDNRLMQYFETNHFSPAKAVIHLERSI